MLYYISHPSEEGVYFTFCDEEEKRHVIVRHHHGRNETLLLRKAHSNAADLLYCLIKAKKVLIEDGVGKAQIENTNYKIKSVYNCKWGLSKLLNLDDKGRLILNDPGCYIWQLSDTEMANPPLAPQNMTHQDSKENKTKSVNTIDIPIRRPEDVTTPESKKPYLDEQQKMLLVLLGILGLGLILAFWWASSLN